MWGARGGGFKQRRRRKFSCEDATGSGPALEECGETDRQYVLDVTGVVDGHSLQLIGRKVLLDVLFVVDGQDDGFHPGPAGCQHLFLDTADGQNIAAAGE